MKIRIHKNYCPVSISMAAILFSLIAVPISAAEEENEDTYSIDLVQTAEVAKEIVEVEDKKVLTEAYTTKEGDYIWKILRNRDLTSKNKLGEVLSVLKKLNPSLTNIDMIHPGEKIIIPLIITPIINKEPPGDITEIETVSLSDLENIEYYTVSKGDSLIKVINDKYSVPRHKLYNEYLDQLRKLNPDLKDLNNIVPGQKIRLPIYSPTIARGTIEEKPVETKQENAVERPEAKEIGDHLGRIFTLIGEECIQQGKHYIPLKTGGQIDLNTETYPIINLRDGDKIIVDLFDSLPDKMAKLIKSNWENYHIVHIKEKDDLKSAVAKVLPECNYARIYAEDESLVFDDAIKIELNADWIIKLRPESSGTKDNIICLNLKDENRGTVSPLIKRFLTGHGIKIIEYPQGAPDEKDIPEASGTVDIDENKNSIIEKVLELAGQDFSAREDIPIYQGEDSDFNLTIKADYFFRRNGKDCIIDLHGPGTDIINLLKERGFTVLSASDQTNAYDLTAKTLDFLGVAFDSKKHTFYAVSGNQRENVKIIIPGILFRDSKGQTNFFTSVNLPADISGFLTSMVDNIFLIKPAIKAE